MIEHFGRLAGEGRRVGIVAGRFNDLVTRRLLDGARDALLRHGVREEDVEVAWVPGAWEIPLALRALGASRRFDALIALGAVIRGATPHFDYVSSAVASGIAAAGTELRMPVVFGVLTTDTVEQALDRAGLKAGNKGADAASAALEMIDLLRSIGAGWQREGA